MEEKMQNERENRGYCLKGDFSAILATQMLSFSGGKMEEMLHAPPWEAIIQIWLQIDFLIWYLKETTDDVPVECLHVDC